MFVFVFTGPFKLLYRGGTLCCQVFEPSTIDKLVKKKRRVLVSRSRKKCFIRSKNRLIVLQKRKVTAETSRRKLVRRRVVLTAY